MSNQTDKEEVVVFITAPNEENASVIAKDLVESKLAACVNIVKNMRSIYLWQSKVEDDFEVLMIVKTRRTLFKELSSRVKELHSYEVPEVIALPIVDGADDYLQWLRDSTK
jgi:periplasmic divalent cation tolerance protein